MEVDPNDPHDTPASAPPAEQGAVTPVPRPPAARGPIEQREHERVQTDPHRGRRLAPRKRANDRTIDALFSSRSLFAAGTIVAFGLTACGGGEATTANPVADSSASAQVATAATTGIRVVAPEQAALTIADPPADLVILDVRTQEEFDDGHLDGAVLLDFYRDDFAAELATFDRTVPYVLYCRSGNRSGQARAIMHDLGFQSVEDIDGGIVGWQEAGLQVVTD